MVSHNERESLAAKFDRHVEEEGKILAEYRALSEQLGHGSVGFMLDLILTEEELHHLLLRTIAKWLREPPSEEASRVLQGANRDELLRRTQTLQEHEKETIEGCRSMKSELPEQDRDLLNTFLDVMILDSEKHHRLLLTIEKLLKD
jgi:hypothetical protein